MRWETLGYARGAQVQGSEKDEAPSLQVYGCRHPAHSGSWALLFVVWYLWKDWM